MDGTRRERPFSALHLWAWWTTPSSVVNDDLVAASCSDFAGAGISEADINKFLDFMAEDHTHAKAADDLRKGKYTTGWIYCFH